MVNEQCIIVQRYTVDIHVNKCLIFNVGLVELSPSGTLMVCGVGETAEVMCTTEHIILKWQITLPGENGRTETRHQTHDSLFPEVTPLQIGQTTFKFRRVSPRNTSPLTSRLEVENVSAVLNGTVINCTEVGLNLMNPDTAETVILILGQNFTSGKHIRY